MISLGRGMFFFTLIGLFVLGLAFAWIARRVIEGLGETSALTLMMGPLVIYGIVNGAISEFSGFGVTTKFSKVADTKVTDLAGKLAIRSRLDDMDFAQAATFQACTNYFIIRDDFGNKVNDPSFTSFAMQVATAIKSAMLCGDFYGVVVVDTNDHFLGLFQAERFASLIAYPLDRYCIFEYKHCSERIDPSTVLAETELGPILKDPNVRVKSAEATKHVVQESESIGDIVRSPDFAQASTFAVLDKTGKFVGLLPKQAIYDKVLAGLLEPH